MSNATPSRKTEEQIHYESLKSFLLRVTGIVGSLIVVLAGVAIYFTFSDRNAMREEYSKTIIDLKSQITDIKNDAKETAKYIKDDSRQTVRDTREYAQQEIS